MYSIDELCVMLRVSFLYVLFNGFTSPRLQILTREFRFLKKVLLNQGAAVIGIAITIILAFVLRNVWAIVIGNLAGAFLLLIFSFAVCPFRPRLRFHKESLLSILSFARGMLGLPMLTYFSFNMDILVLGKVSGAEIVGMYGLAMTIANMPRDLFVKIVSPVLLPAFAEKQNHNKSLCRGLLVLAETIGVLTLPMCVLGAMCGKTILTVIYSSDYAQAAGVLGVLFIYIAVIIQTVLPAQIFYAIGKPGLQRFFVLLRTVLIASLIYPLVKWHGMLGAAATLVSVNFLGLCLQIFLLHKEIGLKISHYAAAWLSGIVIALIEVALLLLIKWIGIDNGILVFGIGIAGYIVLIGLYFLYNTRGKLRTEKPCMNLSLNEVTPQ